ncbi:MAG: hypothetical protein AAGB93_11320 [Planctomycetota bacterium]
MRIHSTQQRHARDGQRGVALLYAVFGTVVVASMVSVMFTMAGVSDRQSDVRRGRARASYVAEGALRTVVKDLQTALAAWEAPPTTGVKTVAGVSVDYSVVPLGPQVQSTDASGVVVLIQPYEVETSVRLDDVAERAHRIVNATWTPLFQFAVFYNDDLEIHAGPDMELRGRVHTNGDMYLGGGSTITLDTNYVRAVGGILRKNKLTGNAAGGNVDIRQWVADPFGSDPSEFYRMLSQSQLDALHQAYATSGYDSSFAGYDHEGNGSFLDPNDLLPFDLGAAAFWGPPDGYGGGVGQTVMTGAHGVREAVTPTIESLQMYDADGAPGYYFDNAGLSIVVDPTGRTFTAYDGLGNDITAAVAPALSIGVVSDMRQSGSAADPVPTIEVDMQLLAGTGHFPANGLLYAAHESMGSGTAARGITLTNGAELQGALTVASPSPVYVQGDYNVVDKKGASVIGDAVNLLSNAWTGSKRPGMLPEATETTYNFAMVTGSYDTIPIDPDNPGGGRYNGGLENLPRFHENWTGVPCNISGSFVNLADSQFATGDWTYGGDRYTAPIRNWQYDPLFNSLDELPPFTPMAVEARDVVSW